MADQQVIQHEVHVQDTPSGLQVGFCSSCNGRSAQFSLFSVGSWLVWWAINLQRQFAEDEIRSACQRVMPETVERCVDTVIIQRGGARR
jgi:hypothetical protein